MSTLSDITSISLHLRLLAHPLTGVDLSDDERSQIISAADLLEQLRANLVETGALLAYYASRVHAKYSDEHPASFGRYRVAQKVDLVAYEHAVSVVERLEHELAGLLQKWEA